MKETEEKQRKERIELLGKKYGNKFFNTIENIAKNHDQKLSMNNLYKMQYFDSKKWNLIVKNENSEYDFYTVENNKYKLIKKVKLNELSTIIQRKFNNIISNTINVLVNYNIINKMDFKKSEDGKGIEFTYQSNKNSVSLNDKHLILEKRNEKLIFNL